MQQSRQMQVKKMLDEFSPPTTFFTTQHSWADALSVFWRVDCSGIQKS